ncbi:DUF3124 domain-containing protein [Desulfogranum mediterraneum]|uniref:DUF3124 domain-containing protein n=1 Tax=Desulfogranum mediterraneum TaxID=160661 RepID=UPI0004073747|nr:DUF3124 domain-containing protein [Desulfogranum mediterraneum]
MNKRYLILLLFLALLAPTLQPPAFGRATTSFNHWLAQTVYVPLYSHIYADERYKDKPFLLTATLSVRNTDPERTITLRKVNYYDSQGKLLQKYLEKPLEIGPLGSTRYIVRESESKGGSGAKFLVHWDAPAQVTEPIIESIMIGTKMQQGISFISRGRVIKGTTAP